MLTLSYDDVRARVLKTQTVQKQLEATWIWPGASLADWEAGIQAMDDARDAAQDAVATTQNARATLTTGLKELHEATKQALGIAKVSFRSDPGKAGAFVGLQATQGSFVRVTHSAQALSSAWQKADPAWTPLPGKTLAAYDALRTTINSQKSVSSGAVAGQKNAQKALQDVLKAQDRLAKDWYAVASRVFPDNTPEGQLLRAEIPT